MTDRACRFISSRPGWTLALLWLVFVAWRPAVLGFYGDDWISIIKELAVNGWGLSDLWAAYPSRPGWVAFAAVLGPLCGADPVAWHAAGAVIVGFAMWGVFRFAAAVFRRLGLADEQARFGAATSAAAWLLFPWGISVTLWPEAFAVALGVGAITLSGACLLSDGLPARRRVPGAILGFVVACLVYEAFWGFYIPVLMIAFVTGRERRGVVVDAVALTAVQVALIAFNRWAAALGHGAKSLAPDWPLGFAKSLFVQFPFELANAAGLATLPVALGGVLLIAAAWRARPPAVLRSPAAGVFVASLCGIAGACLLFALGGYRMIGNGQLGTTFAAVNLWLAFLVGWAAAPAAADCAAGGVRLGLAVLLIGLAVINPLRVWDWARGWRFQQDVLASLPVDRLMALPKGTPLLAELPRPLRTVAGFHVSWAFKEAISVTYPDLYAHLGDIAVANATIWFSRWDGTTLKIGNCNEPDHVFYEHEMPGSLAVWRPGSSLVTVTAPPYELGCEHRIPAVNRLLGIFYPFAENPFDL